MNELDQSKAQHIEQHKSRRHAIIPAARGQWRSSRNKFATAGRAAAFPNLTCVRRTQESGSSEMRQQQLQDSNTSRRPNSYHKGHGHGSERRKGDRQPQIHLMRSRARLRQEAGARKGPADRPVNENQANTSV